MTFRLIRFLEKSNSFFICFQAQGESKMKPDFLAYITALLAIIPAGTIPLQTCNAQCNTFQQMLEQFPPTLQLPAVP